MNRLKSKSHLFTSGFGEWLRISTVTPYTGCSIAVAVYHFSNNLPVKYAEADCAVKSNSESYWLYLACRLHSKTVSNYYLAQHTNL